MRALVTGAAGFLGVALARALRDRGDSVRALVRRPSDALAALGAEVAVGDATDAGAMRAAVTGCDVVFHLAGVRRATDAAEFMRVNAESTRVALEACRVAAPGLSRFVLAGSLAATGPSREPLREDAPHAPVEAYGRSKAEAERIALSFADRVPVAIARPPRIMGPGDRENLLFFRIAAAGFALSFGDRPLSWIDVDDCARLPPARGASGRARRGLLPRVRRADDRRRAHGDRRDRARGPRAARARARVGAPRRRPRRRRRDAPHGPAAPAEPQARGPGARAGLGLRSGEGADAARVLGGDAAPGVRRARRAVVPRARLALRTREQLLAPCGGSVTTPTRRPAGPADPGPSTATIRALTR
jgi:2-alkyl-3-oxoalkanoate reductase